MFDTVRKYTPFINWVLAGNPVNWVIIILMIAIAGLALAYIFPHDNAKQETAS